MSTKIAFLPVLASQKGFFNFKELSTQFTSFVANAAKAIVASEEDLTEEVIKSLILEAADKMYSAKSVVKGKKTKDPEAPKQAKSAYIFFCAEKRQEVKDQNPEMDSKDITRELGKMWGALSEKEKEPFNKLHAEDKARYEKEKEEYKSSSESSSESESEDKPKKAKPAKKETKKAEKKPAEKKETKKADKKPAEKKEEPKAVEPAPEAEQEAEQEGFDLVKAEEYCKNRTTAELLEFVRQHIENPEAQKPALSKWKKTELIAKALEFLEEMDLTSF